MSKHKHKSSFPLRNSDFPNTFISEIDVSLDDPDHWVTLVWKGPNAKAQKTGPFKSSPGAGVMGMDCNDVKTSQTNGSMCTPKGTRTVESLLDRLSDDEHAVHVTMFDNARGIALSTRSAGSATFTSTRAGLSWLCRKASRSRPTCMTTS
jgi:hypothetical protein